MRKLFSATVAAIAVTMAGSALAADLPITASAPFAQRWTGCYFGGSVGGGFAHKNITDPAQLVQDSFLGPGSTPGITTTGLSPDGVVIGVQLGCDYQFAPSWVVGMEGAASGARLERSATVGLPLGAPDTALMKAKTDFLASVTARLGYTFDNVLLYARGGGAMAGDRLNVTGSFMGMPFGFEGLQDRLGWVAGAGVEWAFSPHWSVNLEYDYYGFGHRSVAMLDTANGFQGRVDVGQNIQVVKVGVNFHIWGNGW